MERESFASADDQTAAAARREEEMPKVEVLQPSGADKPCPPVKRSQKSKFMAMADLPTSVRQRDYVEDLAMEERSLSQSFKNTARRGECIQTLKKENVDRALYFQARL